MLTYLSSRGGDENLDFAQALLSGLARDGGLYLPSMWPQLSRGEISGYAAKPYHEVAFDIMRRFTAGAIDDDTLASMTRTVYDRFSHPAVAPLSELAPNHWMLELYHGPTLAFKDLAMQILGAMMDHVLRRNARRATIIGATSGDTGGAAIEALRGLEMIDLFILHPHGRVSDVQRRQMTTVTDANIHNIALQGNFDDCQAIVKGMFNNLKLRDRLGLAGVNSINWARVMAQIVYYFTSAAQLGAPERAVSFTVPTGNFGDIFAGYAAKRMGLNIDRLVIATNVNDILARTLKTGEYRVSDVIATASPSMDIQISSNFERLLFEASGRDAVWVKNKMNMLTQSGRFEIDPPVLAKLRQDFDAVRIDEAQTAATMRAIHRGSGLLIDPHTAVGVAAAGQVATTDTPMITLSTAHPAKFPDAVIAATGETPSLPAHLADLHERSERFEIIENSQQAVETFIDETVSNSGTNTL